MCISLLPSNAQLQPHSISPLSLMRPSDNGANLCGHISATHEYSPLFLKYQGVPNKVNDKVHRLPLIERYGIPLRVPVEWLRALVSAEEWTRPRLKPHPSFNSSFCYS